MAEGREEVPVAGKRCSRWPCCPLARGEAAGMVGGKRRVGREEEQSGPIPRCDRASEAVAPPVLDHGGTDSEIGVTWDYRRTSLGVEPCRDVLHPPCWPVVVSQ